MERLPIFQANQVVFHAEFTNVSGFLCFCNTKSIDISLSDVTKFKLLWQTCDKQIDWLTLNVSSSSKICLRSSLRRALIFISFLQVLFSKSTSSN